MAGGFAPTITNPIPNYGHQIRASVSGCSDARTWCWRKSQLILTNGGTRTKSGTQLLSTAGQTARLPVAARGAPLDQSLPGPEGVDPDARQYWH